MKNILFSVILVLATLSGGLAMETIIPLEIQGLIETGEYTKARAQLEKTAEQKNMNPEARRELLREAERLRRIPLDFNRTAEEILEQIQKDIPDATMNDLEGWTADGTLESRIIDGRRWYFNRSVGNLFILNRKAADRRKKPADQPPAPPVKQLKDYAREALDAHKQSGSNLVNPRRYRIQYTLTVKPGEVPAGKTIRCWLPFPKEVQTQTDIRLIGTNPARNILAPNKTEQRTIYMERPAETDGPTTFSVTFEYTAWAFVLPVDPDKIEPYEPADDTYVKYTAERPPQIVFTPEIRSLVKEIIGEENNPYLQAKRIFAWVESNIVWTGALEYSTVPCLALRALQRRTGDCGMQGLLFITLCRAAGIPARWQSGWTPRITGGMGMHDWTQFYVLPHGWLYADPSHGLLKSDDEEVKWFNFGNFNAFRLIVNSDYGMELVPPKTHFRSEPVDFQRGEVEWEGGNLYFNQWEYESVVTDLPVEKES